MTLAWAEPLAWPADRIGDALLALASEAGLEPRVVTIPRLPPPPSADELRWLDEAVARLAEWIDIDANPVSSAFSDTAALTSGAGPALVRLGDASNPKILALLRTTRKTAVFVHPEGGIARAPLERLREALVPVRAAAHVAEIDSILERAGVAPKRRARARAEMLRARFAHDRVEGVWILRRPPSAPFVAQLRSAGVLSRIARLAALHTATMVAFVGSWWVLGTSALAGRLDAGWIVAWVLLLLTMIPLRAAAARVEGTIAIDAGVLIKRRLLAGALALDPDEVRSDGAGRMMSRVLESEAVEQLAIDAGGAALFTTIDLVMAALVLSFGALPRLELAALIAFAAAAVVLAIRIYRRRRAWTDARLTMTHEMIERLVGHRTRLAQEPREDWHEDEDQGAARTLRAAKRLDASVVAIASVLPRAWLVASIAIVAIAIVTGTRNPEGIPVTIGGILVAFRGFRRAPLGVNAIAGAAIAWRSVAPLFRAAARIEAPPSPRVAVQRESGAARDGASASLVEGRDLAFGYPRRRDLVLDGLTFRIAPSERVLVTGPSGGGKSTFGMLLAGLRRPTSGLLLFDGLDASTMGMSAWRRHVTSAPQFHENHVLGATLAFNLLMGRAWPPREGDIEAAEQICRELDLGPLLDRMPAGILQTVGETGWLLSHGERTRLFLARALLQDADVVVLDESFAALDPATLAKAVDCARRRAKTLIVIAHP
jgi:ATP-binding cassette, subfamily B, bacterial